TIDSFGPAGNLQFEADDRLLLPMLLASERQHRRIGLGNPRVERREFSAQAFDLCTGLGHALAKFANLALRFENAARLLPRATLNQAPVAAHFAAPGRHGRA